MTKETVNIHGKNYETVGSRVSRFRKEHKDHSLLTDLVDNQEDYIVMKASILDTEGRVLSTGYAEEKRGSTNINKTSALENCETSAIGRALAAFGFGGTEYASADEVGQAISQQDRGETVKPAYKAKSTNKATDKQRYKISKDLEDLNVTGEQQKAWIIDQGFDPNSMSSLDASTLIEAIAEEKALITA